MIIRVSDLQGEGLHIADPAALASPFADPSWRLTRLDLHVERDAADVVVHGELGATVPQTCGRCLESFPVNVRATVDSRFLPRPATGENVELGEDDLETDFYANDQLDVAALVETETTLALPMKPLCRDDCRGLCPVCGVNRNTVQCACVPPPRDPRLAALAELATRSNN
jgi:uncharacterized protein